MKRIPLIILLFFSSLAAFAQDSKDLSSAEIARRRAIDKAAENFTLGIAIADSLYTEGKKAKDYKTMYYALEAKQVASAYANNDSLLEDATDKIRNLALENNNLKDYFFASFTRSSHYVERKGADALLLANQLLKDAEERNVLYGVILGNKLLGDIYLFTRDEFDKAIDSYTKSIEASIRINEMGNLANKYIQLAKSYNEDHNYVEAQKSLENAKTYYMSPTDSIDYLMTCVDLAYNKNVPFPEFDKTYKAFVGHHSFASTYIDDTKRFYYVRWLIRAGKYAEALRQADSLEIKKDRLLMRCDIYKCQRDFDNYVIANDSLVLTRDSIRASMNEEDFASMVSKMDNIEIKADNEKQKVYTRYLIVAGIAIIALVVLSFLIYISVKRKKNLRKLKQLNEKLQAANDVKTHFIRNMTHELRTPLNAIGGFANIMALSDVETLGSDTTKEMAHMISKSTIQLTNMVDNVVMLTEMDTDSYKMTKTDVAVSFVLQQVSKKVVDFDWTMTSFSTINNAPEDTMMNTDVNLVLKILVSLVHNASKFTNKGKVVLGANLVGKNVEFFVEDTGVGVPSEESEHIFERFMKLDDFVPGAGLGLTLCRSIAVFLGGGITLDSTYTKGARFILSLPIKS